MYALARPPSQLMSACTVPLIKFFWQWYFSTECDFEHTWSRACPWTLKILTLQARRSFLSIPSLRGMAPTMKAASASLKYDQNMGCSGTHCICDWYGRQWMIKSTLKATLGSAVATTFVTRGRAQSSISIQTPPRTPMAGSMSSRFSWMGWS